jgi:hypothetical protein
MIQNRINGNRLICTVVACLGLMSQLSLQAAYFEGFEGFVNNTPPAGWAVGFNQPSGNDNPQWSQGETFTNIDPNPPGTDPLGFNAYQGTPRSFASISWAAGYNSNTQIWSFINSWLFSPVLEINNGDTVEFYARQTDFYAINQPTGLQYPNSLSLRLSTNGASTNIGSSDTSVGDFTTLLVDINPTLTDTGFPDTWTQYTATVTGLVGTVQGRFGFQYTLDPSTANVSSYIGIDSFQTSASIPVPEPSSLILAGLASGGLAIGLRRRAALKSHV